MVAYPAEPRPAEHNLANRRDEVSYPRPREIFRGHESGFSGATLEAGTPRGQDKWNFGDIGWRSGRFPSVREKLRTDTLQ